MGSHPSPPNGMVCDPPPAGVHFSPVFQYVLALGLKFHLFFNTFWHSGASGCIWRALGRFQVLLDGPGGFMVAACHFLDAPRALSKLFSKFRCAFVCFLTDFPLFFNDFKQMSWASLGPCWVIWGYLGSSWGHLGAILGPLGADLAPNVVQKW